MLQRAPDPGKIHLEVVVDEHITHASDLSPGNPWVRLSKLVAEVFGGFADHLQVADHSVLDQV